MFFYLKSVELLSVSFKMISKHKWLNRFDKFKLDSY